MMVCALLPCYKTATLVVSCVLLAEGSPLEAASGTCDSKVVPMRWCPKIGFLKVMDGINQAKRNFETSCYAKKTLKTGSINGTWQT